MNERIKELYNKAWLKVDPSNPQETFTNAFAELIVGECASIYSRIDNGNLHMGTDDYLEALHKTFRS